MTSMSLYIWHLLAIVLALTTLRSLGMPPPTRIGPQGFPEPESTGAYAVWFVAFFVVFLAYLSVLVLLTWSTQYRPLPIWDTPPRRSVLPARAPGWLYVALVVVSGVMVGFGILIVALIGFAGFPLHNAEWAGLTLNALLGIVLLLGGSLLMRSLTRQTSSRQPVDSARSLP